MKDTYSPPESAYLASSASASHDKGDSQRADPLVLQDQPDDDDEPPIRPPATTNQSTQHPVAAKPSAVHHGPPTTALAVEKRPFDRDTAELAQYLHTSLTSGLDEAEAQARLKHYGKNILKGQGKVTVWAVLWRQVSNAMTVILLGALAIAFATEDYAEGGVIAGTSPASYLPLLSSDIVTLCLSWGF
jgi:magnesium-transporting ATPase (P-type)